MLLHSPATTRPEVFTPRSNPRPNTWVLGISGGAKRTVVKIKDRMKKTRPRRRKVSWLNSKNKKARLLYHGGLPPGGIWHGRG